LYPCIKLVIVNCWYPADRVFLYIRFKRSATLLQTRSWCQRALTPPRAPRYRARHPPGEGSGVAMCSVAQSAPPARKGLRCRHVPRGTEPVTWQERASESPRASWLKVRPLRRKAQMSPCDRDTRTTARQGSGITTCPVALDPPPDVGGLQSRHVSNGPWPPSVPVRSQDAWH
jgi:hypothetical protein